MLITGLRGSRKQQAMHVWAGGGVGAGPHAARDLICERRAFVDFEQIEREMFGRKRKRLVHVVRPLLDGLGRQTGDEIEADVREACGAQSSEGAARIGGGVRAPKT